MDFERLQDTFLNTIREIGDDPFRLFIVVTLLIIGVLFAFFKNEGAWFKVLAMVFLFAGAGAVGAIALGLFDPDPIDVPIESRMEITEIFERAGLARSDSESCIRIWTDSPRNEGRLCVSRTVPVHELGASAILDDNDQTAWVFPVGTREPVGYFFEEWDEPVRFGLIRLANGFNRDNQSFHDHGRLKDLEFRFDDGTVVPASLPDDRGTISAISSSPPVESQIILVVINTVHPSTTQDYAALNEFFYSP